MRCKKKKKKKTFWDGQIKEIKEKNKGGREREKKRKKGETRKEGSDLRLCDALNLLS